MAEYLAMRIKEGKLDYDAVILRFPNLQEEIDKILNK